MHKFIGTGVALVTPFKENKSIDFEALERLVEFQITNKIDYLVVLGTTAESATLTKTEKEAIKQTIIKVNNNRLPLVLGIGGNDTLAIVNEIKQTDFTGFDAILSVSPYYNKPTQEGIYEHFKIIANTSKLPIILYNVPGRTASNMLPETIIRLANDFDTIIAVKEASGDLIQAMKIIQNKPKKFLVISGDDMLALPITLAGGSGVISVIGQGLSKDFSKMIQLGLKKKVTEAYQFHYKITNGINLIFEEGNPAGIKSLLQIINICNKDVRLPLVKATKKLQKKMELFLDSYSKTEITEY